MALTLDPKRSSLRIRTFAEGLLSRLAHDLELTCRSFEAVATGDGSCTLAIPIRDIDVAGTLKNGTVDPNGLSASDREDCLGKMRREVFHGADTLSVEATLESIKVISPKGKTVSLKVALKPAPLGDGAMQVKGSVALSLTAIGSYPVKGPMNAFRVKDQIEVRFDLVFVPQPA